ncbi:MAG: double-strand break repair protein AddB [Rhodospirillales bacterium]
MTDKSQVYSIAAGRPFADDLARRILAECDGDPFALADMRILLPTRRGGRALREAFLRVSEGRALLLPRIDALGDIDEDELWLEDGDDTALNLPPAVSGLSRQLLLAHLITAVPDRARNTAQAAGLALELGRLLDQLANEKRGVEDLETLKVTEYLTGASARHWRDTLKFLDVLKTAWPAFLAEQGVSDPAARRNAAIAARAAAWAANPPETPVIAAGSTGSIAATAELLGVVARLPKGRVVLPGLDAHMTDAAWAELNPSHPQYGLKLLLEKLGAARADVRAWPGSEDAPDAPSARRAQLLSEALKPAGAVTGPPDSGALPEGAFENFEYVECAGPEQEADVIALSLREALETPGRTAALVTPDRALAERVAQQMRRWGIEIDDSAGRPLMTTPPAVFMRLLARAAEDRFGPVSTLALLKHPLAGLGWARGNVLRAARRFEKACLRDVRPPPGVAGLRHAWNQHLERRRKGGRADPPWAGDVNRLLAALAECAEPFLTAVESGDAAAVVRAHAETAERLAAVDGHSGAEKIWKGDDGEALAGFISALESAFEDAARHFTPPALGAGGYALLFDRLLAPHAVRPRYGRHPRLFIWGLLEARMQQADVMILGGLNEGVWPREPDPGPWLSRPMTEALGLQPPERRIGLSAHDFVQAACAPRVIITRAAREAGAPTVSSRWLQRIENLVQRDPALKKGFAPKPERALWAAGLGAPGQIRRAGAPKPMPPVDARPLRLPVTSIETWFRDPYSIFARRILKLKPLDALDMEPGPRERGVLIHNILEDFTKAHPGALPSNALERLIKTGAQHFAPYMSNPAVSAFWYPRFERFAAWFIENEGALRVQGQTPAVIEGEGEIELSIGDEIFTLHGRADRIDALPGGGYAVIDYKTGQPPSHNQVQAHLAPQLPLEAYMAAQGAFEGVPEGAAVYDLVYVQAGGGAKPGEQRSVRLKDTDVPTLAAEAAAGLQRFALKYRDRKTPYLSRPRVQFLSRFGDYDHLARVKEWSVGEDSEDGGGAA